MNTTDQTEQTTEKHEGRAARPADNFEGDTQAAKEASDFRESQERGYGWGV